MKQPVILAIDTSCDETAAAVSKGRSIIANVIASQINIHKKWGGVVPHLAKRAHLDKIKPVVIKALKQSGLRGWKNIDAVAVTIGPGLAPALEVGLAFAKELAKTKNKPLRGMSYFSPGETIRIFNNPMQSFFVRFSNFNNQFLECLAKSIF